MEIASDLLRIDQETRMQDFPSLRAAATAALALSIGLTGMAHAAQEPDKVVPSGQSKNAAPQSLTKGKAADCTDRVTKAFEKQRNSGAFRMKSRMINERGIVFMTVDYLLPAKMRQRVKVLTEPAAVETVLIADRAWSNAGGKWSELPYKQAATIQQQLQETVVSPPDDPLKYECAGTSQINGKSLEHYTAVHRTLSGKPEANTPVRHLYIDPDSGLPSRSSVTPQDDLQRPYFHADYTYPNDITIEQPKLDASN